MFRNLFRNPFKKTKKAKVPLDKLDEPYVEHKRSTPTQSHKKSRKWSLPSISWFRTRKNGGRRRRTLKV